MLSFQKLVVQDEAAVFPREDRDPVGDERAESVDRLSKIIAPAAK